MFKIHITDHTGIVFAVVLVRQKEDLAHIESLWKDAAKAGGDDGITHLQIRILGQIIELHAHQLSVFDDQSSQHPLIPGALHHDGDAYVVILQGADLRVGGAHLDDAPHDALGIDGIAVHKNAFALVTRPLALPQGAAKAAIVNYDGFGLRVVYGYDMNTKTDTISIDMLCGVKLLDDKLIAVVADNR